MDGLLDLRGVNNAKRLRHDPAIRSIGGGNVARVARL
jgi:hypothetical protein